MRTNDKKNTSAKKKLIPAVAMLTTSAIMLSTATYAWFTLNRDVHVTGLEMAATAGGGLEISLGQIGDGNTLKANSFTPSMDNISWKSNVTVGSYYEKVGKLKPASSTNATSISYVTDNIYNGGRSVEDSATIAKGTAATLALNTTYSAAGTLSIDTEKNDAGYYLDIPMWIRTASHTNQDITCSVTISPSTLNATTSETADGEELQKAVRVAIIPQNSANGLQMTATSNLNIANGDTLGAGKKTSFFAINYDAYNKDADASGTTANKALSLVGDSATYHDSLKTLPNTNNYYTANQATTAGGKATTTNNGSVFELQAAANDCYSVQAFVVRVWLEGESEYCNDATASQDWNIQLDFTATDKT